jgi:hypothetical protein
MHTPDLSIVIPCYNASATLPDTLRSTAAEDEPNLEIIVVDDGSTDKPQLEAVLSAHPHVRLVRHETNRGMCAGRNSGIQASTGRYVTILDADDRLVPGWASAFKTLCTSWPPELGAAWAACVDPQGLPTARRPEYQGPMTAAQFIREEFAGEYLPVFRGDYIRSRGYVDLGTRKSCGTLSYLTFLQDQPIWISPTVMRIYQTQSPGSVTANWAKPEASRESCMCIRAVLERFGNIIEAAAPRARLAKELRLAVYSRLAGEPGAWSAFFRGASPRLFLESCGTLMVLLLGRRFCVAAVDLAKKTGLVKRYG